MIHATRFLMLVIEGGGVTRYLSVRIKPQRAEISVDAAVEAAADVFNIEAH